MMEGAPAETDDDGVTLGLGFHLTYLLAVTLLAACGLRGAQIGHEESIESVELGGGDARLTRRERKMAVLVLHEDADRAEVHLPFCQKLLAQTKYHGLNVTLGLGYGATERMAYLTYKQTIVLGDVGVDTHGTKRREEEVLLLLQFLL